MQGTRCQKGKEMNSPLALKVEDLSEEEFTYLCNRCDEVRAQKMVCTLILELDRCKTILGLKFPVQTEDEVVYLGDRLVAIYSQESGYQICTFKTVLEVGTDIEPVLFSRPMKHARVAAILAIWAWVQECCGQ